MGGYNNSNRINFNYYINRREATIDRINAIERVLDKRATRGATDKSLIVWLEGLKNKNAYFNSIMDSFIDAIRQTLDKAT